MEDIGGDWPFVLISLNQSVLENKQVFLAFVIFGNNISDLFVRSDHVKKSPT